MARSTSGSHVALGAAVLAALFFPAFTSWCFIKGWRWGVPYSFSGVLQFLVFSLLMAALILVLVVLVRAGRRASSTGQVAGLMVAFVVIFLLLLLGVFWLLSVSWYGGPLFWDLLFGPAVKVVWIYALPLVAGIAYAAAVAVVYRVRK